jgi:hypothetical protein
MPERGVKFLYEWGEEVALTTALLYCQDAQKILKRLFILHSAFGLSFVFDYSLSVYN